MHRDDVAAVVAGYTGQQCAYMRGNFLEHLSTRPPRRVLVITRDQIGALMADGQLGDVLSHSEARH